MPQNVRNFWLSAEIDGRSSPFASGPASKDGEFSEEIFIRRDGQVSLALRIRGIAKSDGTLEILASGFDDVGNVVGRFTVEGKR